MRKCNQCKFAIFEDNGYSNYTVEGTDFTCFQKAHPDGSFDAWYGNEEKLNFAEKCPLFAEGESIKMDVDQMNESSLSEEQKKIWGIYTGVIDVKASR